MSRDARTRLGTIGARLRAAREDLELSQVQAAERCGIPVPTYRKYERDLRQPKGDALLRMAKGLGVRPEWLSSGEEPKRPAPAPGDDRLEYVVRQVLGEYQVEQLIGVALEALESKPHASAMSPKAKAKLVSAALRIYRALPEERRREATAPIIMAIVDELLSKPFNSRDEGET